MAENMTTAYECINAIGNSLELEEMLEEFLSTFVKTTRGVGGIYLWNKAPYGRSVVASGEYFETPKELAAVQNNYNIYENQTSLALLHISLDAGDFVFAYKDKNNLDTFGMLLTDLKKKLHNAIKACNAFESLQIHNKNLKSQISLEKKKNAMNEQLMISQSRMAIMGEMIGMIAHQWRQPITIIGMVTNNLIIDFHMGSFETKTAIKELERVDKQVHYLSRTIDDFRNFFKPNKLAQMISFSEIKHELNVILAKSFESHNIKLRFKEAKDFKIRSFKNEILQVFLNILSNAKDAFEGKNIEDAYVNIEVESLDDTLVFFIQDNAGGIDPSIIEKIFDPYFSTKKEKNGTGLGLYMSAMIVEKHLGGSVMVCSDKNTTLFRVTIRSDKEQTSVY